MRRTVFIYPGDLDTPTGGYRYDRRMIEWLTRRNDAPTGSGTITTRRSETRAPLLTANAGLSSDFSALSLPGAWPFPSTEDLAYADHALSLIADNSIVVIDGLACGVMPTVLKHHAERLNIVALVHHPLALETGLSTTESETLYTLEKEALSYAQHVITTSEHTARSLADYHVKRNTVSVVTPGTDIPKEASDRSDTHTEQATPQLLCVATLTTRKGHSVLFNALYQIRELPWHLHCAGSETLDATTAAQLYQLRQTLGLTQRITLHGAVEQAALSAHYQQADCFVLASYYEGFGMVLTEALAHGLPIICSDAGAMPETVPKGVGLLVPPGDVQALASAIKNVLSDPALAQTLRQQATKARQQLRSWQAAASEFAHVLQQIS